MEVIQEFKSSLVPLQASLVPKRRATPVLPLVVKLAYLDQIGGAF